MTTGEMVRDLTLGFEPVGSWLLFVLIAAILGGVLLCLAPIPAGSLGGAAWC